MGLEAYRINFRLTNNENRQDILDTFNKIGFSVSGNNFSDIYLEKAYDCGYIEVALQNSELSRIVLNEYMRQHSQNDDIVAQPAEDKEKIIIQIAKPNREDIIDCLMADAKEFNKIIPITVINLQTKEIVNFNDYSGIKEHFSNLQNDFKKYYPKPAYPIRCRDVFKV